MQPWQAIVLISVGVLVTGLVTVGALTHFCSARPTGRSVTEIKQRIEDEPPEPPKHGAATGVWPISWTHEAPGTPFSVDEAHVVMQQHRLCGADICARKKSAFRVLIAAGHAVPDPRAEKYLADTDGED
ncbi:hypothetical protein [Nocardia amamiensis]|uniref:hypothetical protein n=1 Tax=Nocardia amamiensis TaxID=404578 RepID=UPI000837339E|nr:hypothetical protein [Nocardia amamiensis]